MITNTSTILYYILSIVRWGGIIIIAIIGMAILITEAGSSKMSPMKILAVAFSTLMAAAIFWILPTMVNYVRSDVSTVVPDQPVGSYQ